MNSEEKLNVLRPFHMNNSLSNEMVSKLVAGYLKYFNFDHTFFLFCKEANIDENSIESEQLVECLQNSLLFMEIERDIKKLENVRENVLDDFGDQLYLLSKADIIKLKYFMEEGKISIRDICSHFRCSNSTIHKIFKKFNVEYPMLKKGRHPKDIDQKMVNEILEYLKKYRVGYQRMTDVLLRKGFKTTQNQVKRIYESVGLYLYEQEYKPDNVHNRRFVAPFVNQIWHTDLHYLEKGQEEEQKYLISFIDDRSRKIIYFEVLDDKTAQSTSGALERAIDSILKQSLHTPHTIVTDNGGEFVADFERVLDRNQIKHYKTQPYSPEENAKIERFWRTYEQAKTDHSTIGDIVEQYNRFWPHKGLYMINKKKMTPQEAWDSMPKFDGSQKEDELKLIYQ